MSEQTDAAQKDAVKDVNEVKEKLQKSGAAEASKLMLEEIQNEHKKLNLNSKTPNAEAESTMKAYMEKFAATAQEQGLIQPLSIEYMNNNQNFLGKDKKVMEDAASKSNDPMEKLILQNVASKYDELKNAKQDNQNGISQDDINEVRKNGLTEKPQSDDSRQKLAKDLGLEPDTNLKGGTTLYDVAKAKLTLMHNALPEKYGAPTQQDVFGEIAKMMQRSNTQKKFDDLKEEDARAGMQNSIPQNWNSLTSKDTLKVYTEEELKQLQQPQSTEQKTTEKPPTAPKTTEEQTTEKSPTAPKTTEEKTNEKSITTSGTTEQQEPANNASVQPDKKLELQKPLSNGQSRTIHLDNADGNPSTITYKDSSGKDVQLLARKADGTWTSKTGDQPEIAVSVTSENGRLTVQESASKKRIEYNNGTVVEMDLPKQSISTGGAEPHVYQTTDGKTWTVDGKPGAESVAVSADGIVTRSLLNTDRETLTSEEVARGREFFLKHFDEIDQSGSDKDGWVTQADLNAYSSKHKAELSPAELKYLSYLNEHYDKVEEANNDETGFENAGITKLDIDNWSQEKLFKAGHGDWIVMAPELSKEEQDKASAFITKNAAAMNRDGDAYINPKEINAFLKEHADDQTITSADRELMQRYMASETEKLRQFVVKNWMELDKDGSNGLSKDELSDFAVSHPEGAEALSKLIGEMSTFEPIQFSHEYDSQSGVTVYDLLNETYAYTNPAT